MKQKQPYDEMLRHDERVAKLRHDNPDLNIRDIGIGMNLMSKTAHIIGGYKQPLVVQIVKMLEDQGGGLLVFNEDNIDEPIYASMNGIKVEIGTRQDFVEFLGEEIVAKIDELCKGGK